MLTFDAPTREFCNIRRTSTNTPLQALVLWNDEQFVEAARVLATRTLDEAGDDRARLARMFRRCAVRAPQPQELDKLEAALARFRARYAGAPEDAKSLVEVGEAPVAARHAAAELAAWTMVASSLLNIDATIVRS
jgi:multidrug resistance efflux pump